MDRRKLFKTGLALAGGSLLSSAIGAQNTKQANAKGNLPKQIVSDKRKLGNVLEVSSIGLGVQNMSRTYQTTIPTRAEMLNIIRKAFENGITLFDAAEAYGPFEVEKILGEAVASFRNKIVIETKFGWNIDQQTGKRLPGLNSRPEHIKEVVEGMLKRLRTDRIDLLYQHRVDPQVPIEDVAGRNSKILEGFEIKGGIERDGVYLDIKEERAKDAAIKVRKWLQKIKLID